MFFRVLCVCLALSFIAVILIFVAESMQRRGKSASLTGTINCLSYLIAYGAIIIFAASDLIFNNQVDWVETAMAWGMIAFSIWRIQSRFNLLIKIRKQFV